MVECRLSKSQVVDELSIPEIELLLKVAEEKRQSDIALMSLAYHDPEKLRERIIEVNKKDQETPDFSQGLARLARLQQYGDGEEMARKIELRARAARFMSEANNGR